MEQSVWNDLEKYLDATQGTDFSLPLRYYAQREKVSLLIKSKASDFIIHDAFESLQGCFANLEGKDKPYLQMASLSQRANMPNEVIDSYLCNVIWENLGSYYINDYQSNFYQHYCPVKVDQSLFKLIEIQSFARDFKGATI